MIRDQAFACDSILGRELIFKQKLTIVYKLHENPSNECVESARLFKQLPLDVEPDTSPDLK